VYLLLLLMLQSRLASSGPPSSSHMKLRVPGADFRAALDAMHFRGALPSRLRLPKEGLQPHCPTPSCFSPAAPARGLEPELGLSAMPSMPARRPRDSQFAR